MTGGLLLAGLHTQVDVGGPSAPGPIGPDTGIPGELLALVLVGALIGMGITAWKVAMSRSMARQSGLDPDAATAVTLLGGDDGFSAAYLAASLRSNPTSTLPEPERSVADRLRALDELHAEGLVSDDERAARRREILDDL